MARKWWKRHREAAWSGGGGSFGSGGSSWGSGSSWNGGGQWRPHNSSGSDWRSSAGGHCWDTAWPASRRRDFVGEVVQFVQIGLGTNTTFIQNLAGSWDDWSLTIDWLLKACSERRGNHVRGVAVEPVPELCKALQRHADALPGVELVQAAIGETDSANAEVFFLGDDECNRLLAKVPARQKEALEWDLAFLQNMSSVGLLHPEVPKYCAHIASECGVQVRMARQAVDVWSYGHLTRALNIGGCELLVVDAEGHDTRILKSLITHCERVPSAWPEIIQFETMGHSDSLEGRGAEWSVITDLEKHGYQLVSYSHYDTHLVRCEALKREKRLQTWASTWACKTCERTWRFPYVSTAEGVVCRRCTEAKSAD